jgi:xeroderma pigmentosum group C-complementing protein
MARDSREAERAILDGATADANVEGDIPLFGVWQTREWHPPRAVNGIVPKNARGNVDLIGAHALPPPGTAHVSLPRVSRVARALRDSHGKPKIDFAPALVGFEYRRGGATLPKFDGVVVCAEHESILRAAWCDAERARVLAEKEKDARRAKRRWRVLLSAVWTRRALRDEFFSSAKSSAKSSAAAIDHDATDHDATDHDARRMDDDASPRDPPPEGRVRPLAGPATVPRSGRVAVVAGGAEAEVEEM